MEFESPVCHGLAPSWIASVHGSRTNCVSEGLSSLPSGFPHHLHQDLAWTGPQLDSSEPHYILSLTADELVEVRSAKDHFKALELDGDLVSRENFPLPTLGSKLEALGQDLYNGKGLSVVRGINPDDYSVEDLTIIWLGIQAYIADQRGCQDHRGNMLVHIVADGSSMMKLGHHRHSTSAISFHNEEAGDVVAWLTRSTAASGGKCIVASAYTIYNVLAAHRPDIIRTLAKSDWPFALPHFQCRPILFYQDSRLIMNFGRTPLLGNAVHPRPEHLPKLNDRQREALDIVEAIAQAVQLEIKTQAGDMHFINNLAVLHRREGFVDGQSAQQKRHLVRMRLRNPQLGWDIPDDLKQEWHDAFETDTCQTWHLEPMPGDVFPLRKYTN
ncbi:Clavaminate synthase-like protein [Annulohypoxylon maeteangense]|uniref:Clavaminate synthase-like protein n=1 Tax=Annulohypoxylon maeteangense TaxID=1927788 RepID=UPI002008933E|nr:Clavaminate synthase-like protein [Annulohypoxylon maeteangense]KAI0890617.1 Clavaminate synthase-like protein [Annulohypoxylon maeteangense]